MKKVISAAITLLFCASSCTHAPRNQESHPENETTRVVPYQPGKRTPASADIDWWAANAQQVQNAQCRVKYPVTTAEIEKYYRSLPPERGYEAGTTEVSGIALVNERPQLVLALAKLLTPADETEKIENLPKNFQTKFKINPTCNKALCAAQKIFGADVGPQMLFLMDKFDVNTSPYSFSNADAFNKSEIADVIRTFEMSHPDQIPLSFNQPLIKFKRGLTYESYGEDAASVLANAVIELFDGWSEQTSLMRQYTLFHELAHNHSNNQFNDYDRSNAWFSISSWKEVKEGEFQSARTKTMKGHPFVSKYSQENPFEDFAESVTAFRLNPILLKKKSPEKYALIKHFVFDGLEYTSADACRRPVIHKALQSKVDQGNFAFNSTDREQIKKACRPSYYQAILGNTPVSFFDACVNYEATLIWHKHNSSSYPDLVPQALFDGKLRISKLKFTKIRKELSAELAPEAANWIYEGVDRHSRQMHSQMSNAEYCDVWTKLGDRVYPEFSFDNKWQRNSLFANKEYKPRQGAARGVCLDLVKGYSPAKPSNTSSFSNWLKRNATAPFKSQLNERGITQETLIKYISYRMD